MSLVSGCHRRGARRGCSGGSGARGRFRCGFLRRIAHRRGRRSRCRCFFRRAVKCIAGIGFCIGQDIECVMCGVRRRLCCHRQRDRKRAALQLRLAEIGACDEQGTDQRSGSDQEKPACWNCSWASRADRRRSRNAELFRSRAAWQRLTAGETNNIFIVVYSFARRAFAFTHRFFSL